MVILASQVCRSAARGRWNEVAAGALARYGGTREAAMAATAREPRSRTETRRDEPAPPHDRAGDEPDRTKPRGEPLVDKINPLRHVAKDLT